MEREAFRQRMQQYKQARENNPQLKYWDWKKYADGGTIDEIPPQTTSERPITNFDPKGDPYNPTYGYNPGAGYVRSVFDLYDAPVIGDADRSVGRSCKKIQTIWYKTNIERFQNKNR